MSQICSLDNLLLFSGSWFIQPSTFQDLSLFFLSYGVIVKSSSSWWLVIAQRNKMAVEHFVQNGSFRIFDKLAFKNKYYLTFHWNRLLHTISLNFRKGALEITLFFR